VWTDAEIPDPRVIREHDVDGRELIAGSCPGVEDVSDGCSGDSTTGECFIDGDVEFGGTIAVEEFQ
jgi:hypothetical protein